MAQLIPGNYVWRVPGATIAWVGGAVRSSTKNPGDWVQVIVKPLACVASLSLTLLIRKMKLVELEKSWVISKSGKTVGSGWCFRYVGDIPN